MCDQRQREPYLPITREQKISYAKHGVLWLIVLIAATLKTSFVTALAVIACWVAGYLTEFAVFRLLFRRAKGGVISKRETIVAVAVVGSDLAIVSAGYGLILAAAFVCFLIIDALILKFR
jgi:uncharacterized membrane protein